MDAVAVVGGTGFLGRHVEAALREAGFDARALSRRTGFDALRPDPAALRGVGAVVNLAGIKRERGAQTFHAVHVELVERLAAAMREAGVRRLVHVSVVVAREAPGAPYPDTKWRGEQAVRRSGLDWTVLRPGVIYGAGDDLLSHLVLMLRAAPVFPIVNGGSAPMMPVDARDVAKAVVSALRAPAAVGKTYDVVGPDRLTLRDVVARVAEAAALPVRIWGVPAALMKLPVHLMEATMRQPLSTRAQLAMLVEGLAGDPEPARRDLGLRTEPFSVERLRPLAAAVERRPPFTLRLRTAPRPAPETPGLPVLLLGLLTAGLATAAFHRGDPWTGMLVAGGAALAGSLALPSVRRRARPSALRVAAGLAAAAALYAATKGVVVLLEGIWPAWIEWARPLLRWKEGHAPAFLGATLPVIVLGEEFLWRGGVTRFAAERLGRGAGLFAGASVYALAHVGSLNPLLLAAAFFCGLFWGWLYLAADDLVTPAVCHLAWDVAVLFVLPLA